MNTKLLVDFAAAASSLAVSANAYAGPSCKAPSITTAQPLDGGALKVSRVAGAHAGAADRWDMRYDAWFCNPNAADFSVSSVKIEHLDGNKVTKTVTTTPLTNNVKAGTDNNLVMVRDDALYAFPLPTSVRLTFTLTKPGGGTLTTITQTHPVAEHVNPGPLHAMFFPMRESDLPAGAYWTQGRHAEDNTFQRYAYDLTVQRWDGSAWTPWKAGTDGTKKTDSLTFDRPVYAMSDGLVIGCNRGAPDNDPSEHNGNVAGGNLLWIRTGNETQLYAHLKKDSIPYELCPFTDDKEHPLGDPTKDVATNAKYRVRAGQLLAHTGNSGFSRNGNSHIHIHTFMGLPRIWGGSETGIDSDARPLEFVNVRVQEATTSNVSDTAWNELSSRHLIPYNARISPNTCGFDPSALAGKAEVAHVGIPGSCFLEITNAMFQLGDRPTYIDVHGSNSTTVWKPGDGTAFVLLAGLNHSSLETERKKWVTDNGFRIQQLEGYAEGGAFKHAVIFAKTPGATQLVKPNIGLDELHQLMLDDKSGFVPVNIAGAAVNGAARFDAVFEKKNVGSHGAKAKIAIADYQAEFDAETKAKRGLAFVDGFEIGGQTFLSAIWYGDLTGPSVALHGQTKAQLLKNIADNAAAGRKLQSVTEYTESGKTLYAAVWR